MVLLVLLLLLRAQPAASPSAQALIDRGLAHEEAGRYEEAARDYAAARDAAERGHDHSRLAKALIHLGYVRYYRGEMNQALVELQAAYDTATAIGDAQQQREALENIAHIYSDASVGQYERAIEYYLQLLPQFEAANEAEHAADTLFNLGSTYDRKGDSNAALLWYRRALAAEEKLGRRKDAAAVKRSMAVTLGKLDRGEEALPLLDDALRVFLQTGDTSSAMTVRQSRGIVNRRLGRLDAAIEDLEATRAWFDAQKNPRFLEKTEDELALAYAEARRWPQAYTARTRHIAAQRELAEKLREEHTSRLRVQFDAEKKEQENRSLLRDAAAASRIRRLQTIILILGAFLLSILTYFLLRLARDARRMRVMAMTDELTRLPNRRHLFAVAAESLQRGPLSLLAIDVDYFKRINDTWGHAAGDMVLQRVAHACRTALRPGDTIGRTGGEEFMSVLPNASGRDAVHAAERLRAAVAALDCSDIDPDLHVTISVGVAEARAGDTIAKLIGRADDMLYRAKDTGRDRVVLSASQA